MAEPNGSGLEPGTCALCGAPVFWVTTKQRGARMPVNPKPDWVVTLDPDGLAVARDGYTSHCHTCPKDAELATQVAGLSPQAGSKRRGKKGGR